ncbi:MAG: hypothetical protein HXS41_15815 [Theionarchaea archaeon]|nr:hypothetical protein [Theionarchaea archaeon]
MGLVNPEDRVQLRRCIIEKIRSEVAVLVVSETERVLRERYNIAPEDLVKGKVLSEADLM